MLSKSWPSLFEKVEVFKDIENKLPNPQGERRTIQVRVFLHCPTFSKITKDQPEELRNKTFLAKNN